MRNVTRILTVLALSLVLAFVNGPQVRAQLAMLTESFETGSPPAGWATSGTIPLSFVTSSTYPTITQAFNNNGVLTTGARYVDFPSFSYNTGTADLTRTVATSVVGTTNATVTFQWYEDNGYSTDCDAVQVEYSTNGTSWSLVGSPICRYNATNNWYAQSVTLPAGAQGVSTLYIGFHFTTTFGDNCNLDYVQLKVTPPPAPPVPVTVGNGNITTTGSGFPYYNFWSNCRTQMLYTKAEILAAGGGMGNISALAFNVSNVSSPLIAMQGFKVSMANTALTVLPVTFVTTGFTVCYNPASYTVPATGWQTITFTTPFAWDGSSNVLVDVCWSQPCTSYPTCYTATQYVYQTAVANEEVGYYNDPTTGCSVAAGSSYSYRPNAQFTMPGVVGHLSGKITSCYNGAVVAGASVCIGASCATTGADGSYVLWNQPIGNQTVTVTKTGYYSGSFPVTIVGNAMTTLNGCLNPQPANLTGIVKDNDTQMPITGAMLNFVNGTTNQTIYSIAGGSYSIQLFPAGSGWTVTATKPGFDNFTATNVTFNGGSNNYNISLSPTANPPGTPAVATLRSDNSAVDITWTTPSGFYEILYDNGVQTGWTIWAQAGNLNAVKFTAPAYPMTVTGGKVNVGKPANYPSPLPTMPPFKMYLYDATGPGGMPGTILATSGDITPDQIQMGWQVFTLPATTITSGDFFLVMKQVGAAPAAWGLAVDTTTSSFRSFSKYVSGNGPWVPAAGNFMMRVVCQGQGGPLHLDMAHRPFVITQNIPGLTFDYPYHNASGYQAEGETRSFNWANMLNDRSVNNNPVDKSVILSQPRTDVGQGYTGTLLGGPIYPENTNSVLYNSGPLVNSQGTGSGGADESVIVAPIASYGWNNNINAYYRVADKFTVAGASWSVTSFDYYTYQTNCPISSPPITKAIVRVWNGKPGASGATVIWGDTTTNRLNTCAYANINRVAAPNGGVARACFKVNASTPGLTLGPGTYWVEWGFAGSASYSGPWAPPITINGQPSTGNAIEYTGTAGGYVNIYGDATTNYPQGMPFMINGTAQGGGTLPYVVFRLNHGNESNQGTWTPVPPSGAPTTNLNMTDNAWPGLGDGGYRWAIKAQYPGPRYSVPTFTNVIGKNWTATVTVNISLTCNAVKPGYCLVKFANSQSPPVDTVYQKVSDTTGIVVFHHFWKGNYNMTVSRMGYNVYTANVDVFSDKTFNVLLIGSKLPPTAPAPPTPLVNDRSLYSWWHPPQAEITSLNEDWSSGTWTTNNWTMNPATYPWYVNTGAGHPAPCLDFTWGFSPANYDYTATSKTLTATNAPHLTLSYDISLAVTEYNDNTTLNTMAAEIWTGNAWQTLKTWDNSNANGFGFTTDVEDISAYSQVNTKIQFEAQGAMDNYFDWYIDNIKLVANDGHHGPNPCVVGYNFYLQQLPSGQQFLSGFTVDTTYTIPGSQVYYGNQYQACVKAVYGSGYSSAICANFTSHFLWPPRNIASSQVECSAYITWQKPAVSGNMDNKAVYLGPKFPPKSPITTLAPIVPSIDQPKQTGNLLPAGTIVYGGAYSTSTGAPSMVTFDENNVSAMTTIGTPPSSSQFVSALVYPQGVSDYCYAANYPTTTHLWKVVEATNVWTDLGAMGTADIRGFAIDPSNGTIYASDLINLYTLNPATPALTLIGPFNITTVMIAITNDASGNLWGNDMNGNNLISINKATGNGTVVGPLGFDPQYAQGAYFDTPSGNVMLAAYNLSNGACEIRTVNTATGNTTVLSSTTGVEMTSAAVPGGNPIPSGLLGYRVYRDNIMIHQVPSPDTLYYYDINVDPGTHAYGVSALYDLTAYPPNTGQGESMPDGPSMLNIVCGMSLPFYEPWDHSSFTFQGWTFEPATQQHWVINNQEGNPLPCADFKWDPPTNNYSLRLESPTLNGGPWTCASIYFDFDYKCIDRNGGQTEVLTPELYYSGAWHNLGQDVSNNGTTATWQSKHINITAGEGKGFKVGFRANGASSPNILHWYVDNINVYGICARPLQLTKVQKHDTVNLSWNPPSCLHGELVDIIFDDGTYEIQVFMNGGSAPCGNQMPVGPTMTGKLVSFDVMLASTGLTGSTQVHVYDNNFINIGNTATFNIDNVDTWTTVTADSIPFTGLFYAMIDIGTGYVNGLGLDQDGPFAASDLTWIYYNGAFSTLNSIAPGVFGPTVAMLRAHAYVTYDDKKSVTLGTPVHPITPPGKYDGKLTAQYVNGGTKFTGTKGVYSESTDGSIIAGYNVYRTDTSGLPPYHKLNNSIVTVTNYRDIIPNLVTAYGNYKYFVTAMHKDTVANAMLCESPGSDTVSVKWPAVGVVEIGSGQIMVYPNPANDNVNVKSTYTINAIEVMNYIGQTVYTNNNVADKATRFSVSSLQSGVYFVKVNTEQGIRTVKVTVTH
jgi:hypothetical protein